jgi:hypothetical protein
MPSPNWSSITPRSAWYYTRNPANPDEFVRYYTTWLEIMRDARANLGLSPSPVAWNGEFTEAMARFLRARGASAAAVDQALAPIRRTPAAFDLRLVGFAIWAAKYPNIPLSQFNQNGQWMVGLSTDPSESAGLILPQFVQQLGQGTGSPAIPNSTLGGGAPTPTPGGTPGGTPSPTPGGGKPPGGAPAVIVTGEDKPPTPTAPTPTPPEPQRGAPVTEPPPVINPGPLPQPANLLPTTSVANSGQQLRTIMLILGGVAVAFGLLMLMMRKEQSEAVPPRLPSRV